MENLDLQSQINFLSDKVKILEEENIQTTNALYELENRLQGQIDALINYSMLNRQVLEKLDGEE